MMTTQIDYTRIGAKLAKAPKQARAIRQSTALVAAARATAAADKLASARIALAERDLAIDTAQHERFTRMFESFDMIGRAAAHLRECIAIGCTRDTPCAACVSAAAALVAFKRQRDAVFALPIIPADIRPGGRFMAAAHKHMTVNATRITHGSMLITASAIDDIVQSAIELCYMSADRSHMVTLNSVDNGWISANGATITRVPTLGALYRFTRLAFYRELALARKTVKVSDSLDAIREAQDDSVNMYGIDPIAAAAVHAFNARPARIAASFDPRGEGANPSERQAAELYSAYANALAQGDTIGNLASVVGIAPATLQRKLSALRIDSKRVVIADSIGHAQRVTVHTTRLLAGSDATTRKRKAKAKVETIANGMTTVRGTTASALECKRVAATVPVRKRTNMTASLEAYRASKAI